ncbi:MAG: hypothetical protein FRX49_05977 [Trebouxia sp. A1-2]|nr:MAG: hypothetical protein FRX49_05977 [Trebouxia sp. A1-2]
MTAMQAPTKSEKGLALGSTLGNPRQPYASDEEALRRLTELPREVASTCFGLRPEGLAFHLLAALIGAFMELSTSRADVKETG